MKALVTGGSGFIGGYLVEELREKGHDVTVLCQNKSDFELPCFRDVKVITGDVTKAESLKGAFHGHDCIFHTVAIVTSYGFWERFQKVGVEGTKNVIEAAVASGIPRFIHLSSMTVYGMRPRGVVFTEETPFDQKPERWNHYVKQKILSEKIVWEYHKDRKIQATVVRPSIVIGPRDRNAVARTLDFLRSPLATLCGHGLNRVPLVVVDELAAAIVRAWTCDSAIGKAYNLSGRRSITQREFLALYAEAAGLRPPTRKLPMAVQLAFCATIECLYRLVHRSKEPFCTRFALALAGNDYQIDCSRAVKDLGWEGNSSYEDAIGRSVKWFLERSL